MRLTCILDAKKKKTQKKLSFWSISFLLPPSLTGYGANNRLTHLLSNMNKTVTQFKVLCLNVCPKLGSTMSERLKILVFCNRRLGRVDLTVPFANILHYMDQREGLGG